MPLTSFHGRSLLLRLVGGAVCANLVLYAFALAYLYQSHIGHDRQAAISTDNLAKTLEIDLSHHLDKINFVLMDIALEAEQHLASGGLNDKAIKACMARLKTLTPELEGIWLSDEIGEVRLGIGIVEGQSIDISDREYFMRQAHQPSLGLIISRPVVGRVTKDWSIIFSRRINNPDGSFAGVAIASLPFVKELSAMFTKLNVGPNSSLAIRDGDNSLATILRYNPQTGVGEIGSEKVSTHVAAKVRDNPISATYTARGSVDNVERVFTHRKIGNYSWYIFVGLSTYDYLASWRREAYVLLSVLLLFTATTVLFTRALYFRARDALSKIMAQERSEKLEALVREQAAQLNLEKVAREAALQRQQAANALAETRNLLESIINSAPDFIWSVDPENFGLLAFNKSIADHFRGHHGFALQTGLRPADLFSSPEIVEQWEEFYRRAIGEGFTHAEYVTAAGGLTLDLYFNTIRNDNGLTGISVFGRDITDRKKSEEQLSRLNRELRAIRECHQILIRAEEEPTLLNDVCRVICDKAGYRMAWVGYAEHDEARTVRTVAVAGAEDGYLEGSGVCWADTEGGQGPTGTAIRTGKTVCTLDFSTDPRMAPWRDKALQHGYRSSIALPLRDARGATFGALMIYSAETNSFSAEEIRLLEELADDLAFGIEILREREAHRKSREDLQNILQRLELATASARMGVWDWNVKDNIMVWDDRMFEFYGLEREAFPNTVDAWVNGLHPEDSDAAIEDCQAALNGHSPFDTQFRVMRPDGSVRHLKADAIVLRDENGYPLRMIGLHRDITAEKFLEEQLRQSQKMEAVGHLAGGVAHDFNNLLSVIIGYCDMLSYELKAFPEQKEYLDQIALAAQKAAQLTNGLLAFSRRQAMVFKLENLNPIVLHVHKFLSRVIGEDVKLQMNCCDAELPVRVDKGQIEQVLINLATNARDAMPNGGILAVKTEAVELDQTFFVAQGVPPSPGRYAMMSVSDTGIGIDREHIHHIFEPFFTTKEVGKGTGLGMAIIYGIVKQHNGFINVYSEVGVGTTFRLYLPISMMQEPSSGGKPALLPPERGSETILVAEDDPAVRSLVQRMLGKHGYEVILAEDGQDAIEKFAAAQDRISLILMDVIMPRKNGPEAYETISRMRPGVKVLYSSGYTADFIKNRGISEDDFELIMKPVQPVELLRKVRQMLEKT